MAPLIPHWSQPSHSDVQEVIFSQDRDEFTSKSVSRINVPPFGLYTKLNFGPCTKASKPTYATVQMGKYEHLNLNSDLVYINHSCEPSVIFDISSLSIIAGPKGLSKGQELTFFYPSTEWDMAQGFDCFCGSTTCRGTISGAKHMKPEQLDGIWLNTHIRELLEEQHVLQKQNGECERGNILPSEINGLLDPTEQALKKALEQAKAVVLAAQTALDIYKSLHGHDSFDEEDTIGADKSFRVRENGVGSRELSGEMGGDTLVHV